MCKDRAALNDVVQEIYPGTLGYRVLYIFKSFFIFIDSLDLAVSLVIQDKSLDWYYDELVIRSVVSEIVHESDEGA